MTASVSADLLDRIDATLAHGLACGALQPIETACATLAAQGIPFQVRWVSSLVAKPTRTGKPPAAGRAPDFDPFLPPDPDLTIAPVGERHLLVLNKFPVMPRHTLLVTRAFEAQTTALTAADFSALAALLARADGLAFYNGGPIAGASQPHRHLQWIPGPAGEAAFLPLAPRYDALAAAGGGRDGRLPFDHRLIPLDGTDGDSLQSAYLAACRDLSLAPAGGTLPPYNLLATRRWMLLLPRYKEHWQDVSLNAMAYAGLLFVRDPARIDAIRTAGPLALLQAGASCGA